MSNRLLSFLALTFSIVAIGLSLWRQGCAEADVDRAVRRREAELVTEFKPKFELLYQDMATGEWSWKKEPVTFVELVEPMMSLIFKIDGGGVVKPSAGEPPKVNTFSIVAFDPATGELGVAVQSKYFGVGSVVPWAESGVGAVATQSFAKMGYGTDGLRLMREGKTATETLEALVKDDAMRAVRQVGMVDAKGKVATHTGAECMGWAGHRAGENFTVQGNLLAGEGVVTAMAEAFEKARTEKKGELADWLMAALEAGQAAGGDKRGQQSAALLVVRKNAGPGGDNDRFIDLRVEDHETPISELGRLLGLHKKFYGRARHTTR